MKLEKKNFLSTSKRENIYVKVRKGIEEFIVSSQENFFLERL